MSEKKQPPNPLRLTPINTREEVTILFNGKEVQTRPGETLSAALLAAGYRTLRYSQSRNPRGMFCGMGACFECLVKVNGQTSVRACQTYVEPGMVVELEQ